MRRMLSALSVLTMCATGLCDGAVPLIRSSAAKDVRITMYVGSDRALVRETCSVLLPKGTSEVQFRWTDANIDGSTVTLHGPADVSIGGLRQPVGASKTLSWPVEAETAGLREFATCYYVTGLKWSVSYYVTFDGAAGTASLLGKLHLTNDSKLPLRDAHLELAVAPTGAIEKLEAAEAGEAPGAYAVLEDCALEPGWQRRVRFVRVRDVPVRIVYRADPGAWKQEVRKHLLLDLTDVPVPGPLPKGHLEVYEMVSGQRVPVIGTDLNHASDKETEVYVGVERDIVFERKILSRRKTDVEFDRIGRVSGFDTSEEVCDSFRNRLATPVRIELVEKVPGKWDFAGRTPPTKKEANEVRWEFELEPDGSKEIVFKVIRHTGSRAD